MFLTKPHCHVDRLHLSIGILGTQVNWQLRITLNHIIMLHSHHSQLPRELFVSLLSLINNFNGWLFYLRLNWGFSSLNYLWLTLHFLGLVNLGVQFCKQLSWNLVCVLFSSHCLSSLVFRRGFLLLLRWSIISQAPLLWRDWTCCAFLHGWLEYVMWLLLDLSMNLICYFISGHFGFSLNSFNSGRR